VGKSGLQGPTGVGEVSAGWNPEPFFEGIRPRRSEMKVGSQAEVLRLFLIELTIRGITVIILQKELQVTPQYLNAVELNASTHGEVWAPTVFLMILHIHAPDWPDAALPGCPRAPKLKSRLSGPAFDIRLLLVENVYAAAVEAKSAR